MRRVFVVFVFGFFLLASLIMFVKKALKELFDICQAPGAVVLFYHCWLRACRLRIRLAAQTGMFVNRRHPPPQPCFYSLYILWYLPLPLILDRPRGSLLSYAKLSFVCDP